MLEFIVAMVIFGTVLLGLLPLVIEYSKAVTSLENCNPETGRWHRSAPGDNDNNWFYYVSDPERRHPDVWYYVPSSDAWVRKLGASASVSTALPAPPPPFDPPDLVADDAYPADQYYSEADTQWVPGSASGYGGDSRILPPAAVGATTLSSATWIFPSIPSGWCEVQATFPGPPTPASQPLATAAQYSYSLDGGGTWNNYPNTVNQLNPAFTPDVYNGFNWYPVMTVYIAPPSSTSTTPQLRVRLNGQPAAGGYVVADAVRLVPVENNVQITSVVRSFDGKTATAKVTVTPHTLRP